MAASSSLSYDIVTALKVDLDALRVSKSEKGKWGFVFFVNNGRVFCVNEFILLDDNPVKVAISILEVGGKIGQCANFIEIKYTKLHLFFLL